MGGRSVAAQGISGQSLRLKGPGKARFTLQGLMQDFGPVGTGQIHVEKLLRFIGLKLHIRRVHAKRDGQHAPHRATPDGDVVVTPRRGTAPLPQRRA